MESIKEHFIGFLYEQWQLHPTHIIIESLFFALVCYFYFRPLRKANKRVEYDPPTEREIEQLLHDFTSESFRTDPSKDSNVSNPDEMVQVHERKGVESVVSIAGESKQRKLIDLCNYDHFCFSTNDQITTVAKDVVRAYGVGSCGPRGFYGTVMPHLDAEAAITSFLGVDNTIIYSFSYSVSATIFPCFSCRGDVLICDEGCWLAIQQGCFLSRSTVLTYRHDDMAHLEEVMRQSLRKHVGRSLPRRAVITEGIFRNSGDICPLNEVMALCRKYKFRIYLDDSIGFGAVGATGRGTPELFNIPTKNLHIYIGSIGGALGSVGGFCAASKAVVEHQRLTASGYVFSASLPPYATASAAASLSLLIRSPHLLKELRHASTFFRTELEKCLQEHPTALTMIPALNNESPVIFLRTSLSGFHPAVEEKLNSVVRFVAERGYLIQRHVFTTDDRFPQYPSLRIALKVPLSDAQLLGLATVVATGAATYFPHVG